MAYEPKWLAEGTLISGASCLGSTNPYLSDLQKAALQNQQSTAMQAMLTQQAEYNRMMYLANHEVDKTRSKAFYFEQKCKEMEKEKNKLVDENKRLVSENERLTRMVKGEYMAKSDFFRRNGQCRDHDEFDCPDCRNRYMKSVRDTDTQAIILSTSSTVHDSSDEFEIQQRAGRAVERKIRFTAKGLNLSEEEINKIKVKDLPKYLKKAEDEITIGSLRQLLKEDHLLFGGVVASVKNSVRKLFRQR